MTRDQLTIYLEREIAVFPGQTALLVSDAFSPDPFFSHQAEARFPSASLIKTPILLTALEQVRQGILSLRDRLEVPQRAILPDSQVFEEGPGFFTLEELLYWMIADSDNTAANVILDTLGLDAVNEYCTILLGLSNTLCQRKMLDFDAARAGLENYTCPSSAASGTPAVCSAILPTTWPWPTRPALWTAWPTTAASSS